MGHVLRLYCTEPPARDRDVAWARFDEATGRCVDRGRHRPDALPEHVRLEAVVAASHVRCVALALPPLPRARLQAAARFALEDQIADGERDTTVVLGVPRSDGRVLATLVPRALLRALDGANDAGLRFARVIAEPALAPHDAAWHWCVDEARPREAFVRAADGSAFAASAPSSNDGLPAELAIALRELSDDARAGTRIAVDASVDRATCDRWSAATNVRFEPGTPWSWPAAPATAFAAATPLTLEPPITDAPRGSRVPLRLFVPALVLLIAALVLHVGASAFEWWTLVRDADARNRTWRELAHAAGLPPSAAVDATAIARALQRRHADVLHARGALASDDALPLLATLARAGLAPGSVRHAVYGDGHWTVELAPTDDATLRSVEARLRETGVVAMSARRDGRPVLRVGAS